MKTVVKFEMSAPEREHAEESLSAALGSYIQEIASEDEGKLNFSNWSPEEWSRFIAIGFHTASMTTFQHRLTIIGPVEHEAPY